MKLTDQLIEAMRSEFGKSKKWYRRGILSSLGMLTLSVALIIWFEGNLAVGLGLALFLLPLALFLSREFSMEHQDRAEKIRRSLMLADALGYRPSNIELAQLKIDLGKMDKSEPLFDKCYYDSTVPVGAKRLIDIISESAFFTHNLSKRAGIIFGAMIAIGIFAIFSVLYTLLTLSVNYGIAVIVAKWAALVMVFLASGDFAYLCRRYYCLSVASKEVLSKSEAFMNGESISLEDAMKMADDYNCAVTQSPTIPGFIYKKMLKSLNEAWRKRHA